MGADSGGGGGGCGVRLFDHLRYTGGRGVVVGCAYSIIYVTHSLVQVLECNNIVQAMNILEGLIPGEDAPKPADANHLSKLFVFSLMWSVGALLELDDRKKVFLR